MKKASNVEEYIAHAGKEAKPILEEVRKIIKSTVPEAEEGINYGFPFYKYNGVLAHFAEYKSHVALGFGLDLEKKDIEVLEKKGYETGQKRIQIRFDQKVPKEDIKRILKEQADKNKAKKE